MATFKTNRKGEEVANFQFQVCLTRQHIEILKQLAAKKETSWRKMVQDYLLDFCLIEAQDKLESYEEGDDDEYE